MTLAKLGTYSSRAEADLIKAKLESFGISSVVQSDDVGAMAPNLDLARGVQVLVRENQLADAYDVLERMLPAGDEAEGEEAEGRPR